jgi:hypothetical protein
VRAYFVLRARRSGAYQESCLNYWTFPTTQGVFSIAERSSRGVDVYFGQQRVGYYRSPVEAAEEIANGKHSPLPCAPEDGNSLGVPSAVHEWTFGSTFRKP